jgi:T-complex protein 1 subunit zeta
MVELMHMKHKLGADTQFIPGIVLDHGGRHPGMPQKLNDCYILTCNISLEYEKSELNSVFVYDNADKKAALSRSERHLVNQRVQRIIDLKVKLCGSGKTDKGFVIINQKGIDPPSLEMLARENILALRRAKRRNMERLQRACGGSALFDLESLSEADLGRASCVWQHTLGEESYTFVEGTLAEPTSCTILVKGAFDHTVNQIKDAVRDGLRAVLNVVEEEGVLPGAGATEIALYRGLSEAAKDVEGKSKIGVQLFGDALLAIPRQLAVNAGLDADDVLMRIMDAQHKGAMVGIDLATGGTLDPMTSGIYDNVCVKRQMIQSAVAIASQLLLVDEILKAGSLKRDQGPG